MSGSNVETCSWDNALSLLRNVQPGLHAAFAAVTFPKKAARPDFFKVTYRYADEIATQGVFNPSLLRGNHAAHAKAQLTYAPIPLGVPLDKAVAVDSIMEDTPLLATVVRKGHIFGVFETLDAIAGMHQPSPAHYAAWNVTAGARSVFIHWPMQDKNFLQSIVLNPPSIEKRPSIPSTRGGDGKYLHSIDWKIVKYIDEHRENHLQAHWQCEVLFVPAEVVTSNSPVYAEVLHYLFRYGWKQSGVVRRFNKFIDNQALLLWEACKKIPSSLPKTAMPLFWLFARMSLISHGIRPGFSIVKSGGSDVLGPFAYALNQFTKHSVDNPKGGTQVPQRTNSSTTSPILFEPCYLDDEISRLYVLPFEPTVTGRLDPRSAPDAYRDLEKILFELKQKLNTSLHLDWVENNAIRLYKADEAKGKYVASDGVEDEVTSLMPNTKEQFFKVLIGIERKATAKER